MGVAVCFRMGSGGGGGEKGGEGMRWGVGVDMEAC